MRVEFGGNAYLARSPIASAVRSVNLYAEIGPSESPAKITLYQMPGLTLRATPATAGAARCAYRASNGQLYEVVGNKVIRTSSAFVQTVVGTIASTTGQVSMADNGIVAVIVDGTTAGYVVALASNIMTTIADSAFYGADAVVYTDTYFAFNRPNTQQYYLSPPNWDGATPFDALDVAAKVGGADDIATISTVKGDIWGIGTLTSQVFTDIGGADFPFAPVQGVFISQGTAAKYSVAQDDLAVYWLSQDDAGHAIFIEGSDYSAKRVSNFAVETAWQKYERIDDAVSLLFQKNGHTFIQITFPTADKTWVYDKSFPDPMGAWSERTYTDNDGQEHRHRGLTSAFAYGRNFMGDWEDGKLYTQDDDKFTDNGAPIVWRRGFAHLQADGVRVTHSQFVADISAGETSGYTTDNPPQISLRWSDTRGFSFGNPVLQSMGATGQYQTQPQWRRLGMARDRVYEVFWSAPVKCAINGAFLIVSVAGT